MVNTIKIFNPRDYPFGKLSINSRDNLYINSKLYPTIANYINSSMLKTPLFKTIIQNIKITDLDAEFNKLYYEEIIGVVKRSIQEGLDSKINENKDMQDVLLSTKNEPIKYITNDSITGIGDDGQGLNIVGKYLEQKRRQMELSFKQQYSEKKQQEWEHSLYEAYLADLALNKLIKQGNDLEEYMGKNPTEIIDMIGRAEIVKSAPSKNFIIEDLYRKQKYKNLIPKEIILAIDNPDSLVYSIRKIHLRQLRQRQLTHRVETVLYMYCEYMLEKNFPDLPVEKYDTAIKEQYSKYGWGTKLELAKKVFELYEKGMFSERLSSNIDSALEKIKVPTENEVLQAEAYVIDPSKKEDNNMLPYQKPTGNPVNIFDNTEENEEKFKPFSLRDHSKLIKIGPLDLIYPTVSHYIYVRLLANLSTINNIRKAYSYIIADPNAVVGLGKFRDPDSVQRIYLNEKEIAYNTEKINLAENGLNVKFANRSQQDLLLDTKNDILIWANFNDPILGIGKKGEKGANFVGKYMMKLRSEIKEQRKTETFDKLSEKDINNLLERDSLIRAWLEMRVKDMCKVIITVKNYMYYKSGENAKITVEFTQNVLDNIYQPCADVFAASKEIKMDTPQWFKNVVYSCPGFSTKQKKEGDKDDDKNIFKKYKQDVIIREKTVAVEPKYDEDNAKDMQDLLKQMGITKSASFPIGKDVVDVLWKRVAVMIWYLIKYIDETSIQNIRRVLLTIEQITSKERPCEKIIKGTLDNCIVSAILNLLKGLISFNKKHSSVQNVDKIDIEAAISIIINKDMKGLLEPRPDLVEQIEVPTTTIEEELDKAFKELEEEEEEEEGDVDDNEEDEEEQEEEQMFVEEGPKEEQDDDDDEEEYEYGEEEPEEDEFGDIFSASGKTSNLLKILTDMPEIKYPDELEMYIMSAVEIIKTQKMSKNVKMNRINFFASQY